MKINGKIKIIIGVAALVIVIGGAAVGYNALSGRYEAEQPEVSQTQKEDKKIAAPVFNVYDVSGNAISTETFLDKPVVLNFWATWCGPCQSEMPMLNSAYEKYKDSVNFVMLNLAEPGGEDPASVSGYLNENGYTFPVYYDSGAEGAYAYGISSIPATVFIDKDGNIASAYRGAMSEEIFERYIKTIM